MASEPKPAPIWLDDGERIIEQDAVTTLLDQALGGEPTPAAQRAALAGVERALAEAGYQRIDYDVIGDTPVGPLFLAASAQGLVDLGFDESEAAFTARMRQRHGPWLERAPKRLAPIARQLSDYFSGRSAEFVFALDLRRLTPFQREVLGAIQQVPAGKTISYGELARRIGKPGAARAVGQALGSNPIPIIIPCHRALAADGSLGGYSGRGGVRTKRSLLMLEGAWG